MGRYENNSLKENTIKHKMILVDSRMIVNTSKVAQLGHRTVFNNEQTPYTIEICKRPVHY